MCPEHLHQPRVGLTQSLFYTNTLDISCNLLNPVLKMRSRMLCEYKTVVSVSVVYPQGRVADWLPWLPLPGVMTEDHTAHITSPGKGQISKPDGWFLLNGYCFHTIAKLKNHKSYHCKSGAVCALLVVIFF